MYNVTPEGVSGGVSAVHRATPTTIWPWSARPARAEAAANRNRTRRQSRQSGCGAAVRKPGGAGGFRHSIQRVRANSAAIAGSLASREGAVNLPSQQIKTGRSRFDWPSAVLPRPRAIVIAPARALSGQFFGPPLAEVSSGHEQPVPIFQQLAQSDPSGRDDLTNKDEHSRWPSGGPSRPNGRLGLGVLRHTSTTRPLL